MPPPPERSQMQDPRNQLKWPPYLPPRPPLKKTPTRRVGGWTVAQTPPRPPRALSRRPAVTGMPASPRLQTRGVTAAGGGESGEGKRAGRAGGGAEARSLALQRGLPAVIGGRPMKINLMPIGEGAPVERCMGLQWGGDYEARGEPSGKGKTTMQEADHEARGWHRDE